MIQPVLEHHALFHSFHLKKHCPGSHLRHQKWTKFTKGMHQEATEKEQHPTEGNDSAAIALTMY